MEFTTGTGGLDGGAGGEKKCVCLNVAKEVRMSKRFSRNDHDRLDIYVKYQLWQTRRKYSYKYSQCTVISGMNTSNSTD
jgi:hypothetical protein